MRVALEEARLALDHNDVPIGAVAIHNDNIIGRGHNQRELKQDPTAHAEMIAIRQAAQHLNDWHLTEVTLYCTVEPCCMCAGAIVLARIPRIVYGIIEPRTGCAGSIADVLRHPLLNHQVDVDVGLFADEARQLMETFFRSLRD